MEKIKLIDVVKMYEGITFEEALSEKQEGLFNDSNTLFNISMYNPETDNTIVFDYQCNTSFNYPDKYDCLMAYLKDAEVFYSTGEIDYLASELGITRPSEAIRVYDGCKKAFNDIVHFLGGENVERGVEIMNILSDIDNSYSAMLDDMTNVRWLLDNAWNRQKDAWHWLDQLPESTASDYDGDIIEYKTELYHDINQKNKNYYLIDSDDLIEHYVINYDMYEF